MVCGGVWICMGVRNVSEFSLYTHPQYSYDVLSVDVGSVTRGLDLPGVKEHCLATRPISMLMAKGSYECVSWSKWAVAMYHECVVCWCVL